MLARVFKISLLSALLTAHVSAATPLLLTTEIYPPFNYLSAKTAKPEGISVDIVAALMARVQQPYSIRLLPWQRAISLAEKQPDTCVFSMSRTPEREVRYRWIGPLVRNDWALFARQGDLYKPASLEDARPYRIGSYQGDAIVQYLRERNFIVDVAVSDDRNPSKLLAGHIDLWATGKLIGQYLLQQKKISGIEPVLTFNHTDMYLACNKDLPAALVASLNDTLRKLEKDGTIDAIFTRYGYSR